jgi:hypothetical protein
MTGVRTSALTEEVRVHDPKSNEPAKPIPVTDKDLPVKQFGQSFYVRRFKRGSEAKEAP